MIRTAIILLTLAVAACTNPKVDAGKAAYVYHKPLVFGQMEYRDTLLGPASTGLAWRLFTIEVDVTDQTMEERLNILTKDNLQVDLTVFARMRVKAQGADGKKNLKLLVEEWGGPDWYEWRVKKPLRTIVRLVVMQYKVEAIPSSTDEIGEKVRQRIEERFKDAPIEVRGIEVKDFDLPKEVQVAINNFKAEKARLEQQKSLLAKTERDARIEYLEALAASDQQRIIGSNLDPLYVQRKAINVYKKLAQSENKTVIVLPSQSQGTALPLILPKNTKAKQISPAEQRYLDKLNRKYGASSLDEIQDAAAAKKKKQEDAAAAKTKAQQEAPAATNDKTNSTNEVPAAN